MSVKIDDYRWLLSPAAKPWIAEAAQADTLRGGEMVRLVQRLRKSLTAERAHLAVELAELRRRARDKFSQAERMFFTRVGLEQATDEQIAAYKAERFDEDQPVADLCCGIGGDLLALGARGPAVGVDASEVAVMLARRNAEVNGAVAVDLRRTRAEDVALDEFGAWHIDPDRRPSGKRTTRVELHEPSLEILERMLADYPAGAIKLAPAAELPPRWEEAAECEWLGSRGECRQLVVWHGDLARETGRRTATIVDAVGGIRRIIGQASDDLPLATSIGRYVYEPHATVLAARLTAELAREHQLAAAAPRIAYLTGDNAIADPALDGFEVLESLPFDVKRLAALLAERSIGRVEVKKRGVNVDPLVLQKKLQTKADGGAAILLLPRQKQVMAVVARRLR